MINKVIRFSIDHRGFVLLLTLLATVAGLYSFRVLPIDAVPDITNVQVQVNSEIEGLAPEEIERVVTYPIETSMTGLAGVEEVRSITRFGLSQVTVVFEEGTDIYRARQLVTERMQTVVGQLPTGVQPELGPVSTGLGEIFLYAIEARQPEKGVKRVEQLMELRALQEWFVKPRLLTVKGVAEVNTIGGYEKQFHIQPYPEKMAQYGIQFRDIEEALEKTNKNVGGGYVQQTAEQFLIQGLGLFKSPDDIRQVPVKSLETLRTVLIGDIAKVQLGKELRTGAALVAGQEAVIGTVMMLMGENSRTVSMRVAERIQEIQDGLPEGFVVEPLYNRSQLVNGTLKTIEHNLVTGAVLVILVLLLLVGNVRAALITAVTIPLSLLVTFILMKGAGISGNLMSLGALDFGIIIDGAVIVLDNCVRHVQNKARTLGRSLSREEVKETVYQAAVEIRSAAGFGELIIVVVFLPIFALVGIEGKMFSPMAATFIFAILAAVILSFTTVPALASLFLSGSVKDREPWLMGQIRRGYAPVLSLALRRTRVTLGVGMIAVIAGVFLFSRLGGEFLPQLKEGSLALQFVRPVNISLDQSVELQEKTEVLIERFPEVARVFSRIGTAEVATDPMGVNLSDTYVMLKPKDQWPAVNGRPRTDEDLEKALVESLEAEIPGQRILVSQPIEMRFNELLEGTRADLSVKVFGEDMDVLADLTRKVASVIRGVPGAGDVEVELKGTSPILTVRPKNEILRRLGVSNAEVLQTVGIGLGGHEVGSLYEGMRRFPVVIRLTENVRSDLDAIRRLPVGLQSNATIPLSDVADVQFEEAYSAISREQAKRRAAILVNPRGRDTEGFVQAASKKVEEQVKLPPGYYLEWGGNFKNLKEARSRLAVIAPLALLIVFMMVYAAFGNIFQTLLIFSCVPLALVGGVLGLFLNDLPFSISAGVGFIALSGIAMLNGVVLVHYYNDLMVAGKSGLELVRNGALIRLRPVLMTALVDVFGFLPMAVSAGLGAEVQKPLASVVIGGIISSTLLTLLVLPVLFFIFEKRMRNR